LIRSVQSYLYSLQCSRLLVAIYTAEAGKIEERRIAQMSLTVKS
jgi:hypothetical protein